MKPMKKLLKFLRSERGRLRDMAAQLKVSPSTILTWEQVPPHHCLGVESFTGISRHELRPDIYGKEPQSV